jgi:hypothetical protein
MVEESMAKMVVPEVERVADLDAAARRREGFRAQAKTVACPQCGAAVGAPCRRANGGKRKAVHQRRVDAAGLNRGQGGARHAA